MSSDEVRAKFRENAALALGDSELAALEEAVLALEEAGDVRSVFQALSLRAMSGV
jgi:hypothetical protein